MGNRELTFTKSELVAKFQKQGFRIENLELAITSLVLERKEAQKKTAKAHREKITRALAFYDTHVGPGGTPVEL